MMVVGFLMLEGGLRIAIFHPVGPIKGWTTGLRNPRLYAHPRSPFYWELRTRLKPADKRKGPEAPHALLGWISPVMDGTTLEHPDLNAIGDRRPVVLYGDSFANCAGARDRCWQQLLAESDLGSNHVLLNHGVGGYGLDQAVILMASTLDDYRDTNALVLLGILVDDDLDRTALRFRGWPKPKFELGEDASLDLQAPEPLDIEEWLEAHPLPATCWSWRLLTRGTSLFSPASRRQLDDMDELEQQIGTTTARLLRRAAVETEMRGLELAVVLFHGRPLLNREDPTVDWREALLRDHLQREQIPWTSSWVAIGEDREVTGRQPADYIVSRGLGRGHYNVAGNEAAFPAIRKAILGTFDGPLPTKD